MVGQSIREDIEHLIQGGNITVAAIEELMRHAEERYRDLFQRSNDAMYFTSRTGHFVDFNQAMLDLFGYTTAELHQLHAKAIYAHPEDRERFLQSVNEQESVRAELELIRKDGSHFLCWISTTVRKDQDGQVIGYQGIIQDLSEIRNLEDERDRFFSLSRDMICTVKPDGYFRSINPAFSESLGMSPTEILSGNFFQLLHPEDASRAQHRLAAMGEGVGRVNFEVAHRRQDGEYILVDWGFSPDVNGEIWYGIGTDITERRRNEVLRREKELLERTSAVKAEFLAAMSHEIRTPLNAVVGMSHLLNETRLDPVQRDYVRTLETSSAALLRTVNNVLDWSRLDAGRLVLDEGDFNLTELLDELQQTFKYAAEHKGLKLTTLMEPDVPGMVCGDAFRLGQVLQNLLANALKFTEEGSVSLQVRMSEKPAAEDEIQLEFEVSDTGIGIEAERQAAVFDPFSQAAPETSRKFGGTGLGLAIVRRMLKLMGGSVKLESEPGKGSTFLISLPLRRASRLPVQDLDQDNRIDIGQRHFLVVEDNPVNRMVVRELVRQRWPEVTVEEAPDGESGLRMLSHRVYDLVLMDVMMPGIDGREATLQLRDGSSVNKRTPVLGLTAMASPEELQECLAAGMDDCLSKPVQPEDFYSRISHLLGEGGTEDEEGMAVEPEVDLSYLDKLTVGKPELRAELMSTMIKETPEELDRLRVAAAAGRWSEVRAFAHRLKSTLQLLGSRELRDRLEGVEQDARDERDTETLPGRIENLDHAISAALARATEIGKTDSSPV